MPKKQQAQMEELKDVEATAPLWVMSFADLSLLLLSFFILMLAISNQHEIHDEDLLRILASIRAGFGYVPSKSSADPFDAAVLQVLARSDRGSTMRSKMRWTSPAVEGQLHRPRDLFSEARSAVGVPIVFAPNSAEIPRTSITSIEEVAEVVRNHFRMIIVEGHCSPEEAARDAASGGHGLAYQRAMAVKRALEQQSVAGDRIRLLLYADQLTQGEEKSPIQRRAVVTLGGYYLPGGQRLFTGD